MNIIQQPDMLSLSMNLKNFIIGSSRQTTFTLKAGDKELVSQVYAPDENGVMEIDIHEIVHSFLSYSLKDIGEVYQQTNLVADFTAVIDSTEITFRVIRSGVDRLTDSATNFLTQNFLTWQPNVKPVTYYSPEFLTYYAVVAGTVKLRAYFTDESGTVKSQTDYTVTELMPGIAYTMPLQYSVVAGWLGHKLPAYYDVWVENTSGQRLTYIQRYYAEDMRSEQEQWVLFENSLGGIDTFRAYGVTTLNGEHTHNIAETDECFQEYRVDTERKFQKNTGYLNDNERKWLLDFFPSQKKYLYAGNYLRQIVVMESNVSFTDRDIPSNYTFTFKYADARPLLNLPRTDLPADILNITVPEVGSFTVPPRLAEFSRLPLSEGALFPIQNPYSEEWSTTNVAAMGYYLADFLSRIFGSGGGVGHKHRNYDLLELLSYIEGYLLVNGQKIKAGYADKAGSVDGMEDMFLHKDRADGTPFPITFGDWVKFGEFLTGISGGCIDKNGILEMEEGIFRKRLFVPEIAYNRVTYFKGRMCASPGGGCTVKEWSDNGDGSYTITPDLTDADGLSQFVDDILTTYFVTKNAEGKLQGFEEMKFRVTSADYTAKTFVMTPKPGTDWKPGDAMVLAQTGNFTDEDRQTYILIDTVNGNNCITFFDHANTWDPEPAQEMSWIGKKKGRTVHGIPADNYSAVFRHVIMSGKIFQVDDITGEAFRVPLFKGTWKKGEKYAYYDEVTHNGSSWICVNEKGTSTEPADGNADWLKYAAKGESGKGIKSTDVEYAISVSNVIAPVDGWQTTSPEWEAGKYIWSRTKIVYSDDEVKYTQAACISGGQGADGKGIKSITEEYYLSSSSATTTGGEWQTTSPAWKNGWYIWTRTRIVFTDDTSTTTNAICVTGSKGADGTSITNCGDWQTGKHIPYMGITKMAGRVFLCVAPDGTDNPPMWTQTINEGRRILQTQNGGKSYGYTITGDLNTAEYELLVENGQDGRDGRDYEWIFKHTTENVTPPTPATSQVDDYVPSGWHDDPIGVSESLPYEWACCRTKKDGVWSAFSPAAIWAKWGFDGESAIVADFDNEMESVALTYEGKTVSQSVLNTTVGMWYGTKKLQLKSISCVTPAGVTESYNVNTGVIAFTVASGISMPARSEVRITVTATVQDTDISRELVFTITGVRAGSPGSDAVLYRLVPSVSSVSKRKDGTYSVASVSCTRTKSVGGSTAVTTDGVLKYSKDGGAEVEIQNGTAISPKNFTAQLQFVFYVGGQVVDRETIPMVVDGNDGNPGKPGGDGESAIVADFDNEMESIALTYEGKTVSQSVLNTTVGMWYGTKKLQLKSISCVTPAGVTESYNVNTGVIAFTVASGISMPARSEVRITVTATVQDTDISRELVFTITGVRAGSPGSDAVLYRLVPSVSSVSKRKDGTYSVASVSCTRTKSVGGSTSITTDGVLKYSKDGGAEVELNNGTAISPKNFTTQLQFVFYVGGQVVDRETIPMVVDGTDGNPGKPGGDGESVKAGGEWRTANTPYKKLTICTMGGRSWLSKVDTSNPPLWTQTTHDGRRITQTQNGGKSYGYIITEEVNTDEWEQLTSDGGMVYLISTCSNIRVSNAGSLVPSAFRVYAKRTLGSATLTYPDGYLAARGYSNGIWSAIAGPSRASEITVNASAGYSTFSVRCYQSQADASAWNDSFIAEISVGVSYDGASGRDASEPRPRGFFTKGNTYVWNEDYHDIVLATFNNRTIPFRVRAYGTSVTVAPTSIDGDANWEAAQQYMFVAMDMALARKIRADEILVDDLVVQNVLARDKTGKAMCQIDGENGGIGFLAGGNIRWDAKGNVFQDASIFRKLKLLESKSDSNEYYLDFNTGLNFEISRIFSLPTQEETIYLPNAAEYEGGECMLYNGGIYTRLTGPASIKVAGGGSFIIDGEYYSKIVVPSLSIAQFKAVATYSDGVKDEVKWVLISGKAESKI